MHVFLLNYPLHLVLRAAFASSLILSSRTVVHPVNGLVLRGLPVRFRLSPYVMLIRGTMFRTTLQD